MKASVTISLERIKKVRAKKSKTLIMVSGGLDSIAALVWLLENTEDAIHVHHVRLFNKENRQAPEQEAYVKCMEYIKENYRPIHHITESVVSWPEPWCPFDMFTYMFQAALIVNQYKDESAPNKICTGSIDEGATDPERLASVEQRRTQAWDMVKSCVSTRWSGSSHS